MMSSWLPCTGPALSPSQRLPRQQILPMSHGARYPDPTTVLRRTSHMIVLLPAAAQTLCLRRPCRSRRHDDFHRLSALTQGMDRLRVVLMFPLLLVPWMCGTVLGLRGAGYQPERCTCSTQQQLWIFDIYGLRPRRAAYHHGEQGRPPGRRDAAGASRRCVQS